MMMIIKKKFWTTTTTTTTTTTDAGGVSVQFAFDSMTISSSGTLARSVADSEGKNVMTECRREDDESGDDSERRVKFNELIHCDCELKGLESKSRNLCRSLRCRLLWLKNKLGSCLKWKM